MNIKKMSVIVFIVTAIQTTVVFSGTLYAGMSIIPPAGIFSNGGKEFLLNALSKAKKEKDNAQKSLSTAQARLMKSAEEKRKAESFLYQAKMNLANETKKRTKALADVDRATSDLARANARCRVAKAAEVRAYDNFQKALIRAENAKNSRNRAREYLTQVSQIRDRKLEMLRQARLQMKHKNKMKEEAYNRYKSRQQEADRYKNAEGKAHSEYYAAQEKLKKAIAQLKAAGQNPNKISEAKKLVEKTQSEVMAKQNAWSQARQKFKEKEREMNVAKASWDTFQKAVADAANAEALCKKELDSAEERVNWANSQCGVKEGAYNTAVMMKNSSEYGWKTAQTITNEAEAAVQAATKKVSSKTQELEMAIKREGAAEDRLHGAQQKADMAYEKCRKDEKDVMLAKNDLENAEKQISALQQQMDNFGAVKPVKLETQTASANNKPGDCFATAGGIAFSSGFNSSLLGNIGVVISDQKLLASVNGMIGALYVKQQTVSAVQNKPVDTVNAAESGFNPSDMKKIGSVVNDQRIMPFINGAVGALDVKQQSISSIQKKPVEMAGSANTEGKNKDVVKKDGLTTNVLTQKAAVPTPPPSSSKVDRVHKSRNFSAIKQKVMKALNGFQCVSELVLKNQDARSGGKINKP